MVDGRKIILGILIFRFLGFALFGVFKIVFGGFSGGVGSGSGVLFSLMGETGFYD